MRGSLVALGITVVVAAAAVLVPLTVDHSVPGRAVAGATPFNPIPPEEEDPGPTCAPDNQLTASGSALASGIVAQVVATYESVCDGAVVDYTPVGTEAGIQQFSTGATDMAVLDRPLEGDEAGTRCEVEQYPFAVQPVVVSFTLPGISGLILDAPTLARIFSGRVTRWDDRAIARLNKATTLPSTPITVVAREDEATITAVFQQYLAAEGGWDGGTGTTFTGKATVLAQGNDAVRTAVQSTDGAIGYHLTASGTLVRIDGFSADLYDMGLTVNSALPDKGLALDTTDLYRTRDGYPLVSVAYAVACDGVPAVKDFLLSALAAQLGVEGFLLATGEWGDRVEAAVR
jgi:phosphate transport system substrate-binding protein